MSRCFWKSIKNCEIPTKKSLGCNNLPEIWIHSASLLLRCDKLKTVAAQWIAEAKLYRPDNTHFKELVSLEYGVYQKTIYVRCLIKLF